MERIVEIKNHETVDNGMKPIRLKFRRWSVVLILGLTFLLYLSMTRPERFGEPYDDAIYVTAAKSLATGEGYRIISLPEPVAQTLIPPLYPFVLSLIWRAYPNFPSNLLPMMILSVLMMVGFLGLAWRYLVEQRYATHLQATAIVALAGINWRMMTLGTSVVSEIPFALLSVGTLYAAEKYQRTQNSRILGCVVGILAGLTFLTRTSGIVLLAAIAGYLLFRRQWSKAWLPLIVGVLFVVGWFSWCYVHRTSGGGEHASYYAGYARGIEATLSQLQLLNQTTRLNVQLKIFTTNAIGLLLVWLPVQTLALRSSMSTALLVPIVLLFLAFFLAGLVRGIRKRIRLLHIYLAFYVVLHLVVPSHSYERYLMPIVPLLLVFPINELANFFSILRRTFTGGAPILARATVGLMGLVVMTAASLALYSNASGIFLSIRSPKPDAASLKAQRDTFDWIRNNTNADDVLVSFADPKFYLFTERKSVRSVTVNILDLVFYQDRDQDPDELRQTFLNIVDENRGKYLVINSRDFEYQAPAYGRSVESYIDEHPEQFVPVFQDGEAENRIYRIQNRF